MPKHQGFSVVKVLVVFALVILILATGWYVYERSPHHAATVVPSSPPANAFDVTRYGADPTGHRDSTVAIRNAIAAAEHAGGNQTVYFAPGTYLLNDTSGTIRGKTRDARDPDIPIVAEIDIDGSNGSVINILGAGDNVTKVVEAVGVTNPQYAATLQRGYDAFVFAHMNGFYFSGLTVDSATYTAGDTLEDFGSHTTIENSDFLGSGTSTPTTNPDVFGVRVLGVCRSVPPQNDGAAAGYVGSDFHSGNTVKNIAVSGGGEGGNSDLGIACQTNGTISNVTDTGWGMALYEDYDVTVATYIFTPGRNNTAHPGFYITDSSRVSLDNFRSSGQGGIVGGAGGNITYNTTITNEKMTGSGYTLQIRNATNTTIGGSTLNQLVVKASVGVTITNSMIDGVPCNAQSPGKIIDLSGVKCSP